MSDFSLKPSRISRLIQPRKSSMARQEKRSLSAETPSRGPNAGSIYLAPPKRSRSAVLGTPLKTPIPRTPRRTGFTGTVEQEKRQVNEQAHRIVRCLQTNSIFSADFLAGGLRTMTTKQFNMIIEYFAQIITGNRCKTITTDDTLNFLSRIQYPYIITKSCLKTPNAPHAFGAIVELLSWLTDFIDDDGFMDFENEKNLIDVEGLFPDEEYIKMFKDTVRRNFSLWYNKEDDELEESKTKLVDKFIEKRTGFDSKRQIEVETNRIKKDYDELFRKRFVITNEKILLEKQLKVEQLDTDRAEFKLRVKENESLVATLLEKNEKKQKRNKHLQLVIDSLKNDIQLQSITIQERETFLIEINYKNQLAESLRETINQLRHEGYPNQMLLTQLMKQKVDSASKLNKYLSDVQNLLKDLSPHCKIEDVLIVLDSDNLNEQIDEIVRFLEFQKMETLKLKTQEHTQYLQLKSDLSQMESDFEAQIKKPFEYQKILAELELKICDARRETATMELEIENLIKNERKVIENLIEQNMKKEKMRKELQEQCEQQEKENIEKLTMFKEKSKDLLKKRRALLEQNKRNHLELKMAINDLKKQFEK